MLGIIPAAGKATRWGSTEYFFYKEFLPVVNGKQCLDLTISAMLIAGADRFLVITNPDKIFEHARFFNKKYPKLDVSFVLQKGEELIGAINTALNYLDSINLFAMPDTIFDEYSLKAGVDLLNSYKANFVIGLFDTITPERFGCLIGDTFIDKPKNLSGMYSAWGSFVFRNAEKATSLDEFMNINNQLLYYYISYYYDMASFNDYLRLLFNFGKGFNENTSFSQTL